MDKNNKGELVMSKEKSTISHYDMVEMYDRNKKNLFDFLDFATRNQADITIRINADGTVNFQVVEKTTKKIHWKSLSQLKENIRYEEAENER